MASRYPNAAQAADAELIRLERAARARRLTGAEDARLAELSFRAHNRGTRLRYDAGCRFHTNAGERRASFSARKHDQ